VLLRALAHIAMVASGPGDGARWRDAELVPRTVAIFRPDSAAPLAWELKLETAGRSQGYLVVGSDPGEPPVLSFRTDGASPAEYLVESATAAGQNVARLHQIDALNLMGEDAAGNLVAAFPGRMFALDTSVAGTVSLTEGTAADWPALKASYGVASSAWRQVQTDGFASTWVQEDKVRGDRQSSFPDTLVAPILTATQPVPVRNFVTHSFYGGQEISCQNDLAASPYPTDLDGLTPLWNQIGGDFIHYGNSPTVQCSSGCTPMAMAIILGWMDRMGQWGRNEGWSRPDLRRAFFRYTSPIAPEQLVWDQPDSLYHYRDNAPWSWTGQSQTEPGPGTTPAMDMRRFLTELSFANGTHCHGQSGETYWPNINRMQSFLASHRIPALMHTGSSPFGESGFRDDVIAALRDYGSPGAIHIGDWSGHTVVVNAHQQCDRFQDDGTGTYVLAETYPHYFYVNYGWGSKNANRWLAIGNLMMSTTFRPTSWMGLKVQHTGFYLGGGTALGSPATQRSRPVAYQWLDLSTVVTMEPAGQDGSQYVKGLVNGFCLNTGLSTAAGTGAGFYPCVSADWQRWKPYLFEDGTFSLYHPWSGRCLGVQWGRTDEGAGFELEDCSGAASQRFDIYY
jgi:hypothetical protein